jgi:hypothetical protein
MIIARGDKSPGREGCKKVPIRQGLCASVIQYDLVSDSAVLQWIERLGLAKYLENDGFVCTIMGLIPAGISSASGPRRASDAS